MNIPKAFLSLLALVIFTSASPPSSLAADGDTGRNAGVAQDCPEAPESVLLDLSARDLLNSKEPDDLMFAAGMAKIQRFPGQSWGLERPCLFRSSAVPESSSRYLLQLIDKFPGYHPGYPTAIAYCDNAPTTLDRCPADAEMACTIDVDTQATADLCGRELGRLWTRHDPDNGLAWRELAMRHYRHGEVAEAYTLLEKALAARSVDAYSKQLSQAMWGSARRLYPRSTLEYLLQSEASVALPDIWANAIAASRFDTFFTACRNESSRDPRWRQLCLALAERIATETDLLLEAAVANDIALTLLEDAGSTEALLRAEQRRQIRKEMVNCSMQRYDQNDRALQIQALDVMARVGELEAMRQICERGLAAAYSSQGSD